jgi:phosphoesterase RecJ-like protein
MRAQVADRLRSGERFVILSHVDPDGDALGTALGLAWILRKAGKHAEVGISGPIPRVYDFLPGVRDLVLEPGVVRSDAEAVVVVDTTSAPRLGAFADLLGWGLPVINVDHHADNTRFGDLDWIDPSAAAASLMIQEMAFAEGLAIPREAATNLYVGILTDTGRFTFSNADARALGAAADLANRGADPREVAVHLYEGRSIPGTRLLGCALATLDVREDGRVACLHVTLDMIRETGALPEDTDGFSTWARSLDGVQVGLFFRETEEGSVKVSFRSNEGVEIDGVAGRFGGGGHPRASGARVSGPIEKAKEEVLRAVAEHLRSTAA